jgi:hypothetical protein
MASFLHHSSRQVRLTHGIVRRLASRGTTRCGCSRLVKRSAARCMRRSVNAFFAVSIELADHATDSCTVNGSSTLLKKSVLHFFNGACEKRGFHCAAAIFPAFIP